MWDVELNENAFFTAFSLLKRIPITFPNKLHLSQDLPNCVVGITIGGIQQKL